MENVERAKRALEEFQAVREAALAELRAQRAEIDAKIQELLNFGGPVTSSPAKKRGRPPKARKVEDALPEIAAVAVSVDTAPASDNQD